MDHRQQIKCVTYLCLFRGQVHGAGVVPRVLSVAPLHQLTIPSRALRRHYTSHAAYGAEEAANVRRFATRGGMPINYAHTATCNYYVQALQVTRLQHAMCDKMRTWKGRGGLQDFARNRQETDATLLVSICKVFQKTCKLPHSDGDLAELVTSTLEPLTSNHKAMCQTQSALVACSLLLVFISASVR
jgi:hypothetical protein